MVRSVEVIRKELTALDETTATLAAEFTRIYGSYLEVLGRAVRQQVVIATYHLCTQVYPDSFLALSVKQREQLQKNIRKLGGEGQAWLQQIMEESELEPQSFDDLPAEQQARISRLTAALEAIPMDEDEGDQEDTAEDEDGSLVSQGDSGPTPPPIQFIAVEPDSDPPSEPAVATDDSEPVEPQVQEASKIPENLGDASDLAASDEDESSAFSEEDGAISNDGDMRISSKPKLDPKSLIQSVLMAAMADEAQERLQGRPFTGENLTPTLLAKHHLILEQQIRQVLHRISKRANHYLKQAEVIPDLPEAVLDAAAEAETGPEKGRSMPNLLNVLVEMATDMDSDSDSEEDDSEDDEPLSDEDMDQDEGIRGMMTHLAAINLRLSDLEFADVQSSVGRSKLRTALGKLRKLGKQYQRTQRELAIAEAEQAWRAVWYDDSSD
jgi:hypothetical protein